MKPSFPIRVLLFLCLFSPISFFAQTDSTDNVQYIPIKPAIVLDSVYVPKKDTVVPLLSVLADPVMINAFRTIYPPESQYYNAPGAKTSTIRISETIQVSKDPRQLFEKLPGVFTYDMDGAGNQLNFSLRGLDPHRGWEFNNRHDGIITNSDMYGYPASHYSQPLESVQSIIYTSGAASGQYGAQFGGAINIITKDGDPLKKISGENISSVGSYNLVSNYTALGGTVGKWTYYGYFYRKVRNGYRDEEFSKNGSELFKVTYRPNARMELTAEYTHSSYLIHLPGPLNDSMFYADPKQSTRSRNYYSPTIHIPSIRFNYSLFNKSFIQVNASWLIGDRSSVLFDGASIVPDTINSLTGKFANRRVDIDSFNSKNLEAKWVTYFENFSLPWKLTMGTLLTSNDLRRRQMGTGSAGSDYDLELISGTDFKRDMHYESTNAAVYADWALRYYKNWDVHVNVRYENGTTQLTGRSDLPRDTNIGDAIKRSFVLFSAGARYFWKNSIIYFSTAQAYRPVVFKDMQANASFERVDINLQDAKGWNTELGWKGERNHLNWEVTFFDLIYKNRVGTIVQYDEAGNYGTLRTNIGNSRNTGIELYTAYTLDVKNASIQIFNSTAYNHSRYMDASAVQSGNTVDISGNQVESVPVWNIRSGVKVLVKKRYSFTLSHTYVDESFADALNTVIPDKAGSVGIVPSYRIWDASISAKLNENLTFGLSLNNFMDENFYTKRPQMYPGPGIWSSDGRNCTFVLKLKF
jgi:Fe(3+) dicitrate transport protein